MPRKRNEGMPVMPLRGLMVFPSMVLNFDVGRAKSVAALEAAMESDQRVLLVAQRDADCEDPGESDLYKVGTVAHVQQVMSLPGEMVRVLVDGECRGVIRKLLRTEPCLRAEVVEIAEQDPEGDESQALVRTMRDLAGEYMQSSGRVSQETAQAIMGIEEPSDLCDALAANILAKLEDRQAILEELALPGRMEKLCVMLARELELASLEKQVQTRVKKQVEKNQKDYYLREQIKAIQTELGESDENDVDELRQRLEKLPLNEEARKKCLKELERIARMAPGSPELGMSHTWVEWILDLPWGVTTEDTLDLKRARRVLEEDHWGLEKVKERIIEYLAVLKMKQDMKGPILCFVGPPGVGKTSIVKGIAKALGRNFVQMSLGGVRDEAEIRGHRRTYIGSIPGRIISGMKKAGSMNPVFLFDEIDKMGMDVRGDPASAMLEVLDAEQNHAFRDHYQIGRAHV